MPVSRELLEVLRCPATRGPLREMTPSEVERLNAAATEGKARYADGHPVPEPLRGGLVTLDGVSSYEVRDGVPVLLPGLRIAMGAPAPPSPADGTSLSEGAWASYWEAIASRWDDLRPPRRPAPEDVTLLQELVGRHLPSSPGTAPLALLLGVTPEIATMRWPTGTRLVALDASSAMISHVWPARRLPDAAVIRGDWRTVPLRDGVCDIVLGDASIAAQPYPDTFRAVTGEARRVLRDGGLLAARAFTRPEETESLGAIFADLRAGRIATIDFLRWRLAAALHGDRATGTRMCDIWDAWEANVPDPAELMVSLGWPPETADVMSNLRGGQAVLVFPTLPELRASLAPDFEEVACEFPGYRDGDRYPTLLLRATTRARTRRAP